MERIKGQSGFTLVEIMVVVLIIGLIATIVSLNVLPRLLQSKQTKAMADIKAIEQAAEMFKMDNGFYPNSGEGLNALVQPPSRARRSNPEGYLKGGRVPLDPWDNEYAYFSDGRQIVIKSYGADGAEGGEGDNADIDNLSQP